MLTAILLIVVPLGMMFAGLAILMLQSRANATGRSMPHDQRENLVTAIAWTLVVVGLFAIVGLISGAFFISAWIALGLILPSLVYRFRSTERRSLLWTLMLAAERNIPLDAATRAFASERRDHIGDRAYDLAEYLEAGLPLALALQRSRLYFPQSVLLSVGLGEQTGNLGGSLRRALGSSDESEQVFRNVAERTFYLVCVVLFGAVLVTFMMHKIVPALRNILYEFGTEPPKAMQLLIGIINFLTQAWPLLVLGCIVLVIVMLRNLSYYTGTSAHYMPGILAGWQRTDRSVVMHWPAHAVRQNRPLPEMMRLMAGYLTKRRLRRPAQAAGGRKQGGGTVMRSSMHVGGVGKPNPRRGSILVLVLVSLLVASMLAASLVRTVLIYQRQMRVLAGQQQAFWLAEAGVQRAAGQLSRTAEYDGETWRVPASVLGSSRTAEVTIEVAKPDGEPEMWAIRVQVVLDDGRAEPGGYQREHRFHMPPGERGEKSDQSKTKAADPDTAPSSQP